MSTAPAATPTAPSVSALLRVDSVFPSDTNPRKHFDKAQLDELTQSIAKRGVLTPILVRAYPPSRKTPKGWVPQNPKDEIYELVAGERRLRASKAVGLAEIPALVCDLADGEVLEIQLIENLHRSDLHPLEEAEAFHRLIAAGRDLTRVSERIGRSVRYIYDREKLLGLTKDAQKLFREGKIAIGHAVILARLTPADQERAIGNEDVSPLFEHEKVLWDPEDAGDDMDPRKAVSARELQAWVDKHVRFDRAVVEPMLFPETADALRASREEAEKIVPITHDQFVDPEAKAEGERTYGPQSWRRADGKGGSKACPYAVTGVIVVGFGRGDAFKVCIAKKSCEVHWGEELRAAKKREKAAAAGGTDGESRHAAAQQKRKEDEAKEKLKLQRWQKAAPAITKALAEAVKRAPAHATGSLADLLLDNFRGPTSKLITRGKTAEDLVRYLAFASLESTASRVWSGWAINDATKRLKKLLGIDVTKIVDEAAPIAKAAPAEPKAKAKKR